MGRAALCVMYWFGFFIQVNWIVVRSPTRLQALVQHQWRWCLARKDKTRIHIFQEHHLNDFFSHSQSKRQSFFSHQQQWQRVALVLNGESCTFFPWYRLHTRFLRFSPTNTFFNGKKERDANLYRKLYALSSFRAKSFFN